MVPGPSAKGRQLDWDKWSQDGREIQAVERTKPGTVSGQCRWPRFHTGGLLHSPSAPRVLLPRPRATHQLQNLGDRTGPKLCPHPLSLLYRFVCRKRGCWGPQASRGPGLHPRVCSPAVLPLPAIKPIQWGERQQARPALSLLFVF